MFLSYFSESQNGVATVLIMNLKGFTFAVAQALGLGLLTSTAFATTNTTTFQGQVPGSCSYSGGSDTITMNYNASGQSFSTPSPGAEFSITCNASGTVTLGAVTAKSGGNPSTTSDTATLTIGETALTSTHAGAATGNISISANTATAATLSLASTGAVNAGDYEYTIVVTALT